MEGGRVRGSSLFLFSTMSTGSIVRKRPYRPPNFRLHRKARIRNAVLEVSSRRPEDGPAWEFISRTRRSVDTVTPKWALRSATQMFSLYSATNLVAVLKTVDGNGLVAGPSHVTNVSTSFCDTNGLGESLCNVSNYIKDQLHLTDLPALPRTRPSIDEVRVTFPRNVAFNYFVVFEPFPTPVVAAPPLLAVEAAPAAAMEASGLPVSLLTSRIPVGPIENLRRCSVKRRPD